MLKMLLVRIFSSGSIVKDLIVCLKIERTAAGAGLLGLGWVALVGLVGDRSGGYTVGSFWTKACPTSLHTGNA